MSISNPIKYLLLGFRARFKVDLVNKLSQKNKIASKSLLIHIGILLYLNTWSVSLYAQMADTPKEIFTAKRNISQILPPEGYQRVWAEADSYDSYLQNLALKEDTLIYLYDGNLKPNQSFSFAVLDIDVGTKNLQQCADAVIRLRAEYLFSKKQFDKIHFNFSSGDTAFYTQWREGYRAEVSGKQVRWVKKAAYDDSYANFRKYLNLVFNYAGSWSLDKELQSISQPENLDIGDMLVKGAFPGHVMLIVDKAHNAQTGDFIFLLAQSARPAQSIHVVKNRSDSTLSPWYSIQAFKTKIDIEEWTFYPENLKRF